MTAERKGKKRELTRREFLEFVVGGGGAIGLSYLVAEGLKALGIKISDLRMLDGGPTPGVIPEPKIAAGVPRETIAPPAFAPSSTGEVVKTAEEATAQIRETATSTAVVGNELSTKTYEQMEAELFTSSWAKYQSIPLVTEKGFESLYGSNWRVVRDERLWEIIRTLGVLDASQFTDKIIVGKAFAQVVLAKQWENIEQIVIEDVDENGDFYYLDQDGNRVANIDNYPWIEARGFGGGGGGVFVWGADGLLRMILPLNANGEVEESISGWQFMPEENSEVRILSGQSAYGETVILGANGLTWTIGQVDQNNNLTAYLNRDTARINNTNSFWARSSSSPTEIPKTETLIPTPVQLSPEIVSNTSDQEIFNIIGVPDSAEYSLDVELSPYKILRNQGGDSYALFQNKEGIVMLAQSLETRQIEHAVYVDYQGGVPVLLLTDTGVVERDNGWFQLNNDYPAAKAHDRFAKAFNRGLAMRWWGVNHPEDGENPYGIKKWMNEIPGYQAMEFNNLTRAERKSITDYILKTFLKNLQSAKADNGSLLIELADKNWTKFDAARETLVIKTVLSGDNDWQVIVEHLADSHFRHITTERNGSFLTVFFRQPGFSPTRTTTLPVGGVMTSFLRNFFGAAYFYSDMDTVGAKRTTQPDMTGPILEDMCASGSIPAIFQNYYSYTYPSYDYQRLSLATNSCAVVFGK